MILSPQAARIEDDYIESRRIALDRAHPQLGLHRRPFRVGLSLSGGGIRSATLSLGVLKSLSRMGLIHKFDYLSTVSGGGYTGAFYGSLFTPPLARGAKGVGWTSPVGEADPLGTPSGEAAIRHLRENGRYLSPGSGDTLRLATIAIRGWMAIQLAIGTALVAAFLVFNLLRVTVLGWSQAHTYEVALARRHEMTVIWPVEWLRGYPAGEIWVLSPLIPLMVLALAFAVSLGWAYWLTRYDRISPNRLMRMAGPSAIGTVLIAALGLFLSPAEPYPLHVASLILGWLAVFAFLAYVVALGVSWYRDRKAGEEADRRRSGVRAEQESRLRNIITGWTARMLGAAGAIGAFALVETVAQTLYVMVLEQDRWRGAVTIAAVVGAAIPLLRQIVGQVQKSHDFAGILRRFGRIIALLCALAIAFVIAVVWATVAQYLAWRGGAIGGLPSLVPVEKDWELGSLVWTAAGFAIVAIAINLSVGFLNLSTFSAFYAGRLRRAYLGASNPDRGANARAADEHGVRDDDQGDDITLSEYYARTNGANPTGAPLHLINVTLNETQGGGLVQRDRKGRPMTISPAGYLVAGDREMLHHDFRATLEEQPGSHIASDTADLPLSNWVAISGAALSTGMGRNTSLGLSLLAGLSNVRLGVWWTNPERERGLWLKPHEGVFRYLRNEFTANFAGIRAARWYLTDGGHFENTGIYELVRRRVELIVCCDNGADPDYRFEDIVNLARKLRIDLEAELEFLPASKLDALLGEKAPDRGIFGELSELVRYSKKKSGHGPYAAIARIRIPASEDPAIPAYCGTLILLKPRLTGLEMVDLVDYHRMDETFPQQTTSDQFFDEAQWESYFRLGSVIADRVFASPPDGDRRWSPGALEPVTASDFDWFCDEWPVEAKPEEPADCQCPSSAPPAASGGLPAPAGGASPGGVGTGRLLLALIAGLGTAGVATGVGQSLTNVAVQSITSSPRTPQPGETPETAPTGTEPTATAPLPGEEPGTAIPDDIAVTRDADLSERLRTIVDRLDTIIAQTAPGDTGGLQAQLVATRAALQAYLRSQDPRVLQGILAQVTALRQEATASDAATRGELRRLDASLKEISRAVRDVAPRRNIRGGAQ